MVILRTVKNESFVWKKDLSVEEAQKEMLNLYNYIFQDRNNAPNWGVAFRRSINECDGAYGKGDWRSVTVGNVDFEMMDDETASQIIEDQKHRYML